MPYDTRYWKGLEELAGEPESRDEFAGAVEPDATRRAFLRAAGFSFAAAAAVGCARAPVGKAIPLLDQPEGVVAGRPVYYASTCGGCAAGCGVIVKTRDGRPIKLEGNPDHPVSRGGLCAAGQASILGLYDTQRLQHPLMRGKRATWAEVDAEIAKRLAAAGSVRVLAQTVTSPALRAAIGRFLAQFRDGKLVEYDALSASAILDAHLQTHGVRALPRYRFEKAEVIVSFDADFLGTWISPVEFTAGYRAAWHAQFESRLSLAGSKADRRARMSPPEIARAVSALAEGSPAHPLLKEAAERLAQARGRSLVVCGVQDVGVQALVNKINEALGNYGATVDLEYPSYQRAGNDREVEALLADKAEALLVLGGNPAAELPGFSKPAFLVSFAERLDETAAMADVVCPDRHYLESWGDAEPVAGVVSFSQPVIRPLGDTRPAIESFSIWAGVRKPARELIREQWQIDWEVALRNGFAEVKTAHRGAGSQPAAASQAASAHLAAYEAAAARGAAPQDLHLVLYPTVAMLDGRHAHNPWLHELPDPITKVTWDNYASLSPAAAAKLGVSDGDVVRVESVELPVVVQPGQDDASVAVALGYGRKDSARFAKVGPAWLDSSGSSVGENGLVGRDCSALLRFEGGALRYTRSGVKVVKTGRRQVLARTQDHHTLAGRPILEAEAGQHHEELWPPDHPYPGRRWGMAVDLDACTGCSACVIACQVENNVPVVGKDEVRRRREMHWIRIDRYYSGSPHDPEVAHQPLMCQQCDHASCETVCPVLATVHSSEGLNQQIYNRCVGTRYCANNCAYKARRFNWFDYPRNDRLANMVLNPDVTVRSRGVMEKCTFCVQRVQEAKIEARRRGVPLRDGDIRTACQQSCPAGAIVFGDLNDPNSRVAKLARSGRAYKLLEELNTRPAVTYLKINRETQHG